MSVLFFAVHLYICRNLYEYQSIRCTIGVVHACTFFVHLYILDRETLTKR